MKIKRFSKYLFLYQTSENFPEGNIKKIDFLLVFLCIFTSGGFITASNVLYGGLTIIVFLLVSALIVKNNKINRYSLNNCFIIFTFVLFIFFIKYLFLSELQVIDQYIYRICSILIALLVLLYFSKNTEYFKKVIYIVLYFIMLHALLSFLAWFLVKNYLTFVPSVKKDTFFYIFYYLHYDVEELTDMSTVKFFFVSFLRMSGVFWEPGVLQVYLNILLFISLFIYTNKKIALLSIFCILTTWSSTGFVLLSLQLFFHTIHNKERKKSLGALISLSAFCLLLIPLIDNITDKFEGDVHTVGSSYARLLDTFTALNIIKNNPILGIDIETSVYEKERLKNKADINISNYIYDEREAKDTNALLSYFVFLGIPLGLLILYGLYNQTLFSKNKLIFYLIISISLLTEPIGFYIFPLILLFSSFILKNPRRVVHD